MARKRVLLDECVGREEQASLFGRKAHVYTACDLAVTGKEDPTVIIRAIEKGALLLRWTRFPMETLRTARAALTWALFLGFSF